MQEDFEPRLAAAAAPVRAYHGRVIAAVNVTGPKFRLGPHLAETGRANQAAEEFSAVLGGSRGAGLGSAPRLR